MAKSFDKDEILADEQLASVDASTLFDPDNLEGILVLFDSLESQFDHMRTELVNQYGIDQSVLCALDCDGKLLVVLTGSDFESLEAEGFSSSNYDIFVVKRLDDRV